MNMSENFEKHNKFQEFPKGTSTPSLKSLLELITPHYAADWKEIGVVLGVPNTSLNIIEADYPSSVRRCCNRMLTTWLETDVTASWEKLFSAIKSPAIYNQLDPVILTKLTIDMKKLFILKEFHLFTNDTESLWQSYPEHVDNLFQIHRIKRQGEKEIAEAISMMRNSLMQYGNSLTSESLKDLIELMDDQFYYKKFKTSNISEIFASFQSEDGYTIQPKLTLIDGAAGMGKTTLCKEITYLWANCKLLPDTKIIFSLFLHDPAIKRIHDLKDFIHYFYKFDPSYSIFSCQCADILTKRHNSDILILLDGYDELVDKNNTLIIKNIIEHEVLPQCKIVVTCRAIASEKLQRVADVRVEILGFTEQNQIQYIEKKFKDNPEKTVNLFSYLNNHSDIKQVCYVPILMTILVHIFNEYEELPANQSELYECFITLAILRCLQKFTDKIPKSVPSLDDLPNTYKHHLLQLSEFAMKTVEVSNFVFTDADIENLTPSLTLYNKKLHGLGLFKAAEEFTLKKVENCAWYSFMHLSIHEFLAAYYLKSFDVFKQFQILKKTFFIKHYTNVWVMFIGMQQNMNNFHQFSMYSQIHWDSGIDKGQLKTILQNLYLLNFPKIGNINIKHIKGTFHLFCCKDNEDDLQTDVNHENKSLDALCLFPFTFNWIKVFVSLCCANSNNQLIEIYLLDKNTKDISYHQIVEELKRNQNFSVMLVSSIGLAGYRSKYYQLADALNMNRLLECVILRYCQIDKDIANCLSSYFIHSHQPTYLCIASCTIDQSALMVILQALTRVSKLKMLDLHSNNMTGQVVKDLANVIKNNLDLEDLCLSDNSLNGSVIAVLEALKENSKLKNLHLNNNKITGEVANSLANFIERDSNLEQLDLGNNELGPSVAVVLQALMHNNKLKLLNLSSNSITGQVVEELANFIKNNPGLEEIYLAYNDLKSPAIVILRALKENSKLKIIDLNGNNITEKAAKDLAHVISNNPNLEKLGFSCNRLGQSAVVILQALIRNSKLKSLNLNDNNMTAIVTNHLVKFIKSNCNLEELSLGNNKLGPSTVVILQALFQNTKLKLLNLNNNNMTGEVVEELARVINKNSNLSELGLANNRLGSYAGKILQALKENSSLKVLYLHNNNMTGQVGGDLANVINNNSDLEEIYLSYNDLKSSVVVILQALKNISKIKILDLSCNNITGQVAEDLADVIKNNHNLEQLGLKHNRIGQFAVIVLQALTENSKLKLLNLNGNNMTGKVAAELANVIKNNSSLEELYLSSNDLKSSVVTILQTLKGNSKLKLLDLNSNNMTGEVAEELANVIKNNPNLNHLGLANNMLGPSAIEIFQALKENCNLKVLYLHNNNMTGQVANDLAKGISNNSNLEELFLSNNDLKSSVVVILKALKKISNLSILDLSSNNLTGQIAEDLANVIKNNPNLNQLGLQNNNLGQSAKRVLQGLISHRKLKLLNLNGNNMTVQVAEDLACVIKNNSDLEQLYLSNNDLKSSAIVVLQTLKGNSQLKVLDLNSNNMTGEIANDLASVILNNPNLEQLGLRNNNLEKSAYVILQALISNTKLNILNFSSNNMTGKLMNDLANVIKNNPALKEVYLSNNDLQTSGGVILQALKYLTHLRVLSLSNNYMPKSYLFELVIKNNQFITELWLGGNKLESGLINIARICKTLSHLTVIELSHNNINPTDIIHLSSFVTKISSLHVLLFGGLVLNIKERIHSSVFASIQEVHNNNSNNAEIFETICMEMWRLQFADRIKFCYDIKDYFSTDIIPLQVILSTEQNLSTLLSITRQSKQKLSQIDAKGLITSLTSIIKCLKVLDLGYNNIGKEAAVILGMALNSNDVIEQLWLRGNVLGADGAALILSSLQNFSTLRVLDLSYNSIGSTSANGIAAVIKNNHLLEQLWLDGNKLMTRGVEIIASVLKKHSNLRLLSLSNNEITENAAEELSTVINSNTLLRGLLLSRNQLKSISTYDYVESLERIKFLHILELSNNCINATAADKLAATLSSCICLKELYLGNNNLKTTGVIKICQALIKSTPILQVLSLNDNKINSKAANDICDVINTITNLTVLLLGSNDLQNVGVLQITNTVKSKNSIMQLLCLSDNNVDEQVKDEIKMLHYQCNLELLL